jgi:chromosome segregation ATPase
MEKTDLTIEILKGIREEARRTNEQLAKTNERIAETNERIDETNGRLGETNERIEALHRRQTETELRLATELVAVGSAVREVRDLLREDRALRSQVDDHERRLSAIESRAG